ncbi:MAG: DsbA family oxidoreductase [Proteobacteria bacterium]|nr:DsbA family oxidoreductase [Pseudomonadota bacterium]
MKVMIVSDTICPWCYVGKRRFERAFAERTDVKPDIEWRPFQLNPDMPADGLDRGAYMRAKFGTDERAEEIYATIRSAGDGENIPFAFDSISRVPNTIGSHRLISWSLPSGQQDSVVEGLFRSYFMAGQDIGDIEVLVKVAAAAGLDETEARAYLSGEEGVEQARAESLEAHRLGISGVPCFIFDGKYAVSGAQEPEVFSQVIDLALQPDEADQVEVL